MQDKTKDCVFRPLEEDSFHFDCYQGIKCFNKCCAALNLTLTPYDILRIKNRLRIMSGKFLDEYTVTDEAPQKSRFPMVKLRMENNAAKSCPFVSDKGCAIYEDRPGACRLYPLGRASAMTDGSDLARERFFIVTEEHCLGFRETRAWNIDEWLHHEGVIEYHRMNDKWLKILTSSRSLGTEALERKLQMFFMTSYNIDMFRKFVFQSGLLDRFRVDAALQKKMKSEDTHLMLFGFDWLRFSLFGENTIEIAGD